MTGTKSFDKAVFKKKIADNCKVLFRRNIDEADEHQLFQAIAYSVKDIIIDKWIATQKEYAQKDCKTVY